MATDYALIHAVADKVRARDERVKHLRQQFRELKDLGVIRSYWRTIQGFWEVRSDYGPPLKAATFNEAQAYAQGVALVARFAEETGWWRS